MYRFVPTRPAFCIRVVCNDVILPSEFNFFFSSRPTCRGSCGDGGGDDRIRVGVVVVMVDFIFIFVVSRRRVVVVVTEDGLSFVVSNGTFGRCRTCPNAGRTIDDDFLLDKVVVVF